MKVPQYQEQVGLTPESPGVMGTGGSLEQAGGPGKALQQAGGALTEAAAEYNRHMQHAQQLKDLNDANFAAEDQHLNLLNIIKANPDPNTWVQAYRQPMLDWKENSLSNINDPAVAAAHTKHVDKLLFSGLKTLQDEADTQNAKIYKAGAPQNLVNLAGLYAQATTDEDRARIEGLALGGLDAAVAGRTIWPAHAEELKQKWPIFVQQAQIDKDKLKNAAGTLDTLRQPGGYGLNDTVRAAYIPEVTAELHRQQQNNALKVDQLFDQKQLTPAMLQGMRDSKGPDNISLQTYRMYDAALTAGKAETDINLYIPLWQQAQKGQMDPERVYQGMKAGGLTKQDGQFLIKTNDGGGEATMSFTKSTNPNSPYFKLALKEIDERLRPLDVTMQDKIQKSVGKGVPPRAELYPSHQAAFLFLEACKQAEKDKTLTGPWMMQKVQEIIRPLEAGGMGSIVKAPRGGTPPPPPAMRPVINNKTGQTEFVTPAEYDLILRAQGGG